MGKKIFIFLLKKKMFVISSGAVQMIHDIFGSFLDPLKCDILFFIINILFYQT